MIREATLAQKGAQVKKPAERLTAAVRQEGAVAAAGGGHGAVAGQLAETEDDGITDGVVNEISGAFAADESGLAEGLKMLRGVGLAGAESGGDFADGAAAGFEEMEEAEAGRVGEEAEPLGSELDLECGEAGRGFRQWFSPGRRPFKFCLTI